MDVSVHSKLTELNVGAAKYWGEPLRRSSGPVVAVEAAVLHGFGQMFGGDGGGFIEVGDGAGDFENAVVGAGGKSHAADGHFERALAGIVQRADGADLPGRHARVI